MNTDAFTNRLSDYLDDELSAEERATVESHLAACAECRTTLNELRGVVAEAASLRDAAPGRDLWSGVASRISRDGRVRASVSPFRRAVSVRWSFTLPQIAAAGLTLMVLSGGLVWMARSGNRQADIAPISAQGDLPNAALVTFSDKHYDDAIQDLQRTLDAGRTQLDPETVRVLEKNLEAIDQAIDQCRKALAGDPVNVYLNNHLAEARQRKLVLLRRAAALAQKG
jgi:tetratricopeptide (TPR) repeat protein